MAILDLVDDSLLLPNILKSRTATNRWRSHISLLNPESATAALCIKYLKTQGIAKRPMLKSANRNGGRSACASRCSTPPSASLRRSHDRQCATIGVIRQLIPRIDLEILDQRVVGAIIQVSDQVEDVMKLLV